MAVRFGTQHELRHGLAMRGKRSRSTGSHPYPEGIDFCVERPMPMVGVNRSQTLVTLSTPWTLSRKLIRDSERPFLADSA